MDKRIFSRIRFEEKCTLEKGSDVTEGRLLNVSLKGALIEFPDQVEYRPGEECRLTFDLGNPDFSLKFTSKIIHCRETITGVKFVEADLNSMIHLRNLLEARTADPMLIRRELDFLIEG